MNIRKQLFVGVRTALATAAGLFALQLWVASYLDVAVIHGRASAAGMDATLESVRREEQTKLTTGPMPIAQAMAALAQRGRSALPRLAAKPSSDLSAMSGWMHKPGFKAYVSRPGTAP